MKNHEHWPFLHSFVKVAEAGSFTLAAERLEISKSHLSKQISQLEQNLGTQLLVRTTRKMKLTDEGEQLYLKCTRLFGELEEAVQSAANPDSQLAGHLRVVCPDIIGEQYVARAATEISKLYPQLQVDVQVTMRTIDLIAEGYDIVVRFGDLDDSSLRARQVFALPHVVCASPAYFSEHGVPDSIDQLEAHNCLKSAFEPCVPWHFAVDGKQIEFLPKGSWTSNSGPALVNAALQGVGICRLPEIYLRTHINAGTLVPVLEEFRSNPLPVWMVYPNSRYTPAKVRMFIDYFSDNIERLIRVCPV
ncbi:LysR family transcriptional regulator [Pusillimonas noertemannii]|uniref:LysR family transcriptional regulator n=1 Tax=Pusillimonas noertemannii TaxID=305977 RepID=A0A2U1CNJ0_9BURK|nr:LysR family transcriptional regulator [Pusillimonas noertemannii]NYT68400.1 LysR family transcriptional regulator [Pusillimonas noertemannii]PVY62583.1 LysR family transcriptional regulator [Pusillimonas noertemannii]TFL10468.1 LysR family transcriptional regulator [Pusillimonas noertemannii]